MCRVVMTLPTWQAWMCGEIVKMEEVCERMEGSLVETDVWQYVRMNVDESKYVCTVVGYKM